MTATITPLRVRRAPAVDGPYDDELKEPRTPEVTGSLALALPELDVAPIVPLRLVPPARAAEQLGPCPPLRPLVTRLAQAIVEVLMGSRGAAQLAEHSTFDVLCQLERSAGRLAGRGSPTRPRVTSIHVSEPRARAAEVCVIFDTGERRRALALRLEAPGTRWRCTAMQIA